MKADGKSPPYSTQTSVQEKFKRQFSKSDSKSSEAGSFKKSKTIEEKPENIFNLKSSNSPCEEEIIVKTSEGLLKFKGISKSFTMKLYEWEKSKGIAPESESSAFAFLHPKYQQFIENGNVDEASGLKRAMSVDSLNIKAGCSIMQISQQPSSLSLNDADNLKDKETDNKKVMNWWKI